MQLITGETPTQVPSCELYENFENTFLTEHRPATASRSNKLKKIDSIAQWRKSPQKNTETFQWLFYLGNTPSKSIPLDQE